MDGASTTSQDQHLCTVWVVGQLYCTSPNWDQERGKYDKEGKPLAIPGHNLLSQQQVFLSFGWDGSVNGGSVLSADPGLTSLVLTTTSLAAAAGGLSAAGFVHIFYKNFDLTMFMNGILGGLVGITAGADQMSIMEAIIVGGIGGIVVVLAVSLLDKLKLDDPVGAVAVHLFTGMWGTLAVGIFGELASWNQFSSAIISTSCGLLCDDNVFLAVIGKVWGLRVDKKEELEGLDQAEHGGMPHMQTSA